MTRYAGETVTLVAEPRVDGTTPVLDDDALTDVTATIHADLDTSSTEVLAETSMTYDPTAERWEAEWDTELVDPGDYWMLVRATDTAGGVAGEWLLVRLAAPSITA